jgi:hypothetical protein
MKNGRKFQSSTLLLVCAIVSAFLLGPCMVAAQQSSASRPASAVLFYAPMTKQDRWKDYLQTNFVQPGAYFQAFFTALGDEAGKVPADWGNGAGVFPKHLVSQFARFSIGGTVRSSAAILLGEDTRFHSCRCQGTLARTGYAVSRTFLTYDVRGRTTPNIAGLAGVYSGPMVMTAWYSNRYTALGYGVRQGNLALAITAGIDLIREFSPEIKDSLHRRKPAE